ncbi:MAG: AI-2E family transporter [Polyangiaceae bacterium]
MSVPPPSRLRWFFLASAALSAAVAWGLVLPLAAAAVLAFVSETPIDLVLRKLRRENSPRFRWAVATAFVVLVVAGLLLPLTLAAVAAIQELIALISQVQWDRASEWGSGSLEWARQMASRYGLEIPENEISGRLRSTVTEGLSFLGARLGTLIRSTPTVLFDVIILMIAWITFAVEGRAARDRVLPHLLPWREEREILRKTTAEVLRSVLVANVVVSIAQATVCSIALIIIQLPRALVWGTLSFFLSFVPVVGTMPVTIGAAIYCYSQGRVGAAIFMVAIAAVIGLIDNILRPVFMKSSANLSFLWTFVAFVGGVALLGLPGVIVGPLAFSLFIAYLRAMEILPPEPGKPASPARDSVPRDTASRDSVPRDTASLAAEPAPLPAGAGLPRQPVPAPPPARKPGKKKRR